MNDERRMTNEKPKPDLRVRTKAFALRVIRLYCSLPKLTEAQVLGKQLLRSGTSVGAQYREAVRARSRAEFVSKIETALQELEETVYWIELLADGGIVRPVRLQNLLREAEELTAIFVRSAKTAKRSR
jgi:four helix bundle protein